MYIYTIYAICMEKRKGKSYTLIVQQLFLFETFFHIFFGNYKWPLNKGLGRKQHGSLFLSISEMLNTQRMNMIILAS